MNAHQIEAFLIGFVTFFVTFVGRFSITLAAYHFHDRAQSQRSSLRKTVNIAG